MAVVTVKSKAITNRDATPKVMNDSAYEQGMVRKFIGAAAIASGDSIGSKYIMGSIPSNAVVSSLILSSPDIGTTTVADIGLYKVTADGGAVVDADFFKAAQSLKDGAVAALEVVNGNVVTLANSEKKVYELLGLSADPSIKYDVVLTLTAAADAAGVVQVKCEYAI
jgi:hypothetical protein